MAAEIKFQNAAAEGTGASGEVRCDCGCLLAKKIGDTLELKCRRCKRVVGIAKILSSSGSCECEDG